MAFAEDDQMDAIADALTIDEDSSPLAAELQQFADLENVSAIEGHQVEEVMIQTLDEVDNDDDDDGEEEEEDEDDERMAEAPVSTMPPLRPLTIAPKPTKIPLTLKSVGNQKVLVLQGSSGAQQIKLIGSSQGINLSNIAISKPVTIKQVQKPRTQMINIVQPKKTMMKKVIPKMISKSFENKAGQQIVVLQKSDASIKLVTAPSTPKTLTLSQAHQMGIITSTSKIVTSTSKSNLITSANKPIIVNKVGQAKTIKVIPNLRSPPKILPAPQSSTGIHPKTPTQRIFVKHANVGSNAQFVPGQIIQLPTSSTGHLHQINVPGKGMQYIKLVGPPQLGESSGAASNASGNKFTVAKITPASGASSIIKPLMKIAKPLTPGNIRKIPNPAAVQTASTIRNYTPGKIISQRFLPKLPLIHPPPVLSKSPELSFESNGIKVRKPCNCAKSQCLKLYCECFANGEFCHLCNCMNCYNNLENEQHRQRAIKNCRERNPDAFRPKIGKDKETGEYQRKHTKGCNCKRSGCLKNYCECYEAKIGCSTNCKCLGCKNIEPSIEAMPSSGTVVKSEICGSSRKMPVDIGMSKRFAKLPSDLFNTQIIKTTTMCLVELAKDGQRLGKEKEKIQQELIIQFGKCLQDIIQCSSGRNLYIK